MPSSVKVSGPFFDGRAASAAAAATVDIRRTVAREGEQIVFAKFAESIRDNHMVFESRFTIIEASQEFSQSSSWRNDGNLVTRTYTMPVEVLDNESVVTNETAVYGPWLEGTGSRNQTTRFKGYWGFRRAAQQLETKAEVIAERVLQPYIIEMNR